MVSKLYLVERIEHTSISLYVYVSSINPDALNVHNILHHGFHVCSTRVTPWNCTKTGGADEVRSEKMELQNTFMVSLCDT